MVPHLTLSLFFVIAACGGKSEEAGPQVLTFDGGGDTGVEDSGTGEVERIDNDGDGYTDDVDCADDDETINPSASETCDGLDNNCDGVIDEGLLQTFYPDADRDSYGDDFSPIEACEEPDGYISRGGDCDDTSAEINPLSDELCNGVDDNCDGTIDGDDALDMPTWYADNDRDTFGRPDSTIQACEVPDGFVGNGMDCDDFDALISPFGIELCDAVDNDCNGVVDDDASVDAGEWFRDADGDGWGSETESVFACSAPGGFVSAVGDCNDGSAIINPESTEICNMIDDNCDGAVDEGFSVETYYRDSDGDTYGDSSEPIVSCLPVAGFSTTAGDCDDSEYWSNPGLSELCDEIDNDCDGVVDEDLVFTDFVPDADGDGFGDASGPVVTDCVPPEGFVIDTTDCDDGNPTVNPASVESCNGLDDNCDGSIDEGMPEYTYYADEDSDGFGVPESTVTACDLPPGYSESDADCDDTDDFTYPGAYEFCDGEDDDCNGLVDDGCGYSRDFVLFVTDSFAVTMDTSTWLNTREEADAYCATFAAENGIDGTDFKIVYSTPDEDARDYLDYVPGLDSIFDRFGSLIDDADLYDGTSPVLPDMASWTIVGSGSDGRFFECAGSYPSGSWPICQYCDQKFACGSASDAILNPGSCCWTGNRAIACMGSLTGG